MVQYNPDGSGREVQFKPFSYPDMMHNNGMPKKNKASVEFGDLVTTEFASRTDNLFKGTSGETHKYQVDQNGNVIK